jgi:tripartite-type tricarboxylate transporter receptor subunit TctC
LRSLGVDGLEVEGWAALLAVKGLPEEGLVKLENALEQALSSEQVKQRFAAFGVTPVISGGAKLKEYLIAEGNRWNGVVKTRGIKVE